MVRLVVVDSYHPEYKWSQENAQGFCDALLALGYFDNKSQAEAYKDRDYASSSRVIVKRLWMDTKRKTSPEEQSIAARKFAQEIKEFNPDLIFLGDDNATNYMGNEFLDTNIPMVFWGVNITPVKYGLVDSKKKPGHNVTGVYQRTYYKESLELLKKIAPHIKTMAVLSDDTTTGRIFVKAIDHLARKGELPIRLAGEVVTNDYEKWKQEALTLQKKVDAFFIASSSGLKDETGRTVTNEEVAKWYLNHITIPEAAGHRYRVEMGWLCAADDSGYNQGYEAVTIAHDILAKGADPSVYPPRPPKRGPFMVNRERARMLGITLTKEMGIEEYIENASALKAIGPDSKKKKKIIIVDSYHKGYAWSMSCAKGANAAMLKLNFFDNPHQVEDFIRDDFVETSRYIIQKLWMDTKRKNTAVEMEEISLTIYENALQFKPDLIFLGEDNAAKFLGTKFLDSEIPIVFWGLNNTPVKYGLVDSKEYPGHNVTGVYQKGYYADSFALLRRIVPGVKRFAILSDGSITGRNYVKAIERLVQKNEIPLKLVETVITDDYETWQARALELQETVDAFFMSQFATLKDKQGNYLPPDDAIRWYLSHITIPETVGGPVFVKKGFLCAATDSGYNQGFEAVVMAQDILVHGADIATYKPLTPSRPGPKIANRKRAKMLGITLTDAMGIEQIIETTLLD